MNTLLKKRNTIRHKFVILKLQIDLAGLKETMNTRFDDMDDMDDMDAKFANLEQLILNQSTYVSL